MQPNGQTQQPTQPAPVVQPVAQPQPMVGQPDNIGTPAPAVAPAAPAQEKSLMIKFEDDLQFEVKREIFDDMRFMDLYAEVTEDQLKVSKLVRFLIGSDNYESIFHYYESKGQRFTITKFGEVFEKLDSDLQSNPDFLKQ